MGLGSFLLLLTTLLSLSDCLRSKRPLSYEDELVKQILKKYRVRGKYGRPVRKFNDTMKVTFGIQLTQIMDLNEQDQILTLNVWDQYSWRDDQATWNMTEYGGVNKVRIPWDKVWLPDIKLYNYADYRLEEQRKALCIFHHDGTIFWMPQAVYRSSCNIDVTQFPFDIQTCSLKFGSWTYNGYKLDVHFHEDKHYIDLQEYVPSNAWKILGVPAQRNENRYSCCPEPFVDLTFTLIFQRVATLYNYILILPCILLTSITLILFWIPPESPAKMMLGLTIFIAFFILLKILEKNLPPGISKMPMIGTYYCLNMVIITMSSFFNVLVVNWAAFGQRANLPPPLKMILFDICARVLLMEDLVRPFRDAPPPSTPSRSPGKNAAGASDAGDSAQGDNKWSDDPSASTEVLARMKAATDLPPHFSSIDAKLGELRDFIRAHKQRLEDKDRRDRLVKEWKASALILDRIFFVIYFIIICTSLGIIMPSITNSETYDIAKLREAGLKGV